MPLEDKILQIQENLAKHHIDGWLLYDFHGINKFVKEILEIPEDAVLTRRFFFWIPRGGAPQKILHQIEAESLDELIGEKHLYLSWQDLKKSLSDVLKGAKTVAMEYSPMNNNPYVSMVDGGTLELVKDLGVNVVSSAELLQNFTSVLDDQQIDLHRQAANCLKVTCERAWDLIGDHLRQNKKITEYDVQQFILSEILAQECITEDGPICAVNEHSALPHYAATKNNAKTIGRGDFILIDLWCKKDAPHAVYADITRVAIAASEPTPKQEEIFQIVKGSMLKAIELIKTKLEKNLSLTGAEVDDLCREYIKEKGYGQYFPHRTGHNIGTSVHGAGAHLDHLETVDNRQILPGGCYSLEPGIYLPGQFGMRLEVDLLIRKDRTLEISGGFQENIYRILS